MPLFSETFPGERKIIASGKTMVALHTDGSFCTSPLDLSISKEERKLGIRHKKAVQSYNVAQQRRVFSHFNFLFTTLCFLAEVQILLVDNCISSTSFAVGE